MPFVKGQVANPKGRPNGSKDVKTEQWEQFSEWFLSEGMKRFEEEMKGLNGKDYIVTVKDLMEYFKPKLSRSDAKVEAEVKVKNIDITFS